MIVMIVMTLLTDYDGGTRRLSERVTGRREREKIKRNKNAKKEKNNNIHMKEVDEERSGNNEGEDNAIWNRRKEWIER